MIFVNAGDVMEEKREQGIVGFAVGLVSSFVVGLLVQHAGFEAARERMERKYMVSPAMTEEDRDKNETPDIVLKYNDGRD